MDSCLLSLLFDQLDWICQRDLLHSVSSAFSNCFFFHSCYPPSCQGNLYAWLHIDDHQAYANKTGAWTETTADEMEKCLALIIYMSLVKLPTVSDCWKTSPPFHGSWARAFIRSRTRFVSLMTFLHVSHPDTTPKWQASQSQVAIGPHQAEIQRAVRTSSEH